MRLYAPATVDQVVDALLRQPDIAASVVADERRPARPAEVEPLPAWLDPRLRDGLARRGLTTLYSHQAAALKALREGRDVMVVTPTASGKSLCYNLPVLQAVAGDPAARALYLFPTKALSQDQLAAPGRARQARPRLELAAGGLRRRHARTHPLHDPHRRPGRADQPGHAPRGDPARTTRSGSSCSNSCATSWSTRRTLYRGVFGSHVANVLRRLFRLCAHYGSQPAAHPLLGHHRPAGRARRVAHGPPRHGHRPLRRADRPAPRRPPQPAGRRRATGRSGQHVRPGRAHRPGLHAGRAPDDRVRPLAHRRGGPADAPARGAPRGPRTPRAPARLSRRLPALRAPRHRGRPARCLECWASSVRTRSSWGSTSGGSTRRSSPATPGRWPPRGSRWAGRAAAWSRRSR